MVSLLSSASVVQPTRDVEALAACIKQNGFAAIESDVEMGPLLEPLHARMRTTALDMHANRGPGRICTNSSWNLWLDEWWNVLAFMLCPTRPLAKVFRLLFPTETVQFLDCGGDYIMAGARDDDNDFATTWHTDWDYDYDRTRGSRIFSVSIFVHDVDYDNAPLYMRTPTGHEIVCCGHRGTIAL